MAEKVVCMEFGTWNVWIDVGGTFTDCVAVDPGGSETFLKVLSSGLVKGRLSVASVASFALGDTMAEADGDTLFSDFQRREADTFWDGATLRLLDNEGQVCGEFVVSRFEKRELNGTQVGFFRVNQPIGQLAGRSPDGSFRYELDAGLPAPILGIRLLQGVPLRRPLRRCQVDLATTRGTNALLTRSGAPTALVTSLGLRDFLRIGDQARAKLFALTVQNREPLFQAAIEIQERVLADGTVRAELDESAVRSQLLALKQQGIESLAICLMFGFRYPDHERRVAELASQIGFRSIRCSSDVAPVIKIVPRGETTVLDAYLDPVISSYLAGVQAALPSESALRLMTSSGGLVSRQRFSGKDSVLSGPAGGVVGAAQVGQQLGFKKIIGFDMGGTSTDVSRFDGQYARSYETFKAGVRIVTPMLEVETVAAGGGSICWFDGSRLQVGPHSAGANPGPACYGRGGPLAITDINLFLGRFQPDQFPFELARQAVERRLDEVIVSLTLANYPMTREELANGLLQIANQNMAAAIESVSIAKGFNPHDYLLVSFGGAGSQHCCGVADRLGMNQILDHPQSSVLSAVGIRLADQLAHAVQEVGVLIDFGAAHDSDYQAPVASAAASSSAANPSRRSPPARGSLENAARIVVLLNEQCLPALTKQVIDQLQADGNLGNEVQLECALDLRYRGTDPFLTVPLISQTFDLRRAERSALIAGADAIHELHDRFLEMHRREFGYLQNRSIELVAVRVDARVAGNRLPTLPRLVDFQPRTTTALRPLFSNGQSQQAGMFQRADLAAGEQVIGPAIIADAVSTTIVDAGWVANVYSAGVLLLESVAAREIRNEPQVEQSNELAQPDPVRLEIFNNHFSSIAEQMGIALQKTSVSVNVKERLDFSCAVFSKIGDLVVNAPHIPVHLGAMSETVRSIIEQNPDVVPGDVFATNDPYAGGSHLPDVTVVTPVFSPVGFSSNENRTLWFWVASRSHHAEIGGTAPGSMPANATRLGDEGVLIRNFRLVVGSGGTESGRDCFDALRAHLMSARYPSRSPDENIADLKAQVAANQTGANQLQRLVDQYSFTTVAAYMTHIQAAAAQKVRAALRKLPDGVFPFEDRLDNGATIRVLVIKSDEQVSIDFTGTDPVLPDNLNANRAIVSAAVMYVLRLLIDEEIPLNEGVLSAVRLIVPDCFLNPAPAADPADSPAIVGGNVETSQRIVDCLLGALGLAAASQGTMNNWLMGNERFGYYETVGGGSGATAQGPGADAVHCHMTNTRLTDPEILETRYPVILAEFAIRRGSGGVGQHRGGDGMIREIEFLQPMTVSLLTSRRTSRPFGLAGGGAGQAGRNQLIRAEDTVELPSRIEVQILPGERLRLETPGGGAWGDREAVV